MKNYLSPGDIVSGKAAPAGGLVSGTAYLIVDLFCVAMHSVAAGDRFEVATQGVWDLPRKAETWDELEAIYWDDTAKQTTNVGPADKTVGLAFTALGSGAPTGGVILVPLAETP